MDNTRALVGYHIQIKIKTFFLVFTKINFYIKVIYEVAKKKCNKVK